MPRLKRDEIDTGSDKKDAYDIIAEGIQKFCEIPGCRPKFHLEESRAIVEQLRSYGYLREGN